MYDPLKKAKFRVCVCVKVQRALEATSGTGCTRVLQGLGFRV